MLILEIIKTFLSKTTGIVIALFSIVLFAYFKGKKSVHNKINSESLGTIKKSKKDYERDRNSGSDVAREWLRGKHTK